MKTILSFLILLITLSNAVSALEGEYKTLDTFNNVYQTENVLWTMFGTSDPTNNWKAMSMGGEFDEFLTFQWPSGVQRMITLEIKPNPLDANEKLFSLTLENKSGSVVQMNKELESGSFGTNEIWMYVSATYELKLSAYSMNNQLVPANHYVISSYRLDDSQQAYGFWGLPKDNFKVTFALSDSTPTGKTDQYAEVSILGIEGSHVPEPSGVLMLMTSFVYLTSRRLRSSSHNGST